MIAHGNTIKIFAGNASKILAREVADILKMDIGDMEVGKFSDGEIMVSINETVRGRDVFVIQSTSSPVNDSIMELLIMIDALRRASAGRITAVMPYFGYARQDRKAKARDPITAKLVADIITAAGADRVLTMDLHAPQLQGFFDIPVDHLFGAPVQVRYFLERGLADSDTVVVSPDVGSVKRARDIARRLDCKLAIIDKRRPAQNVAEVMHIIGEVKGKRCIMLDDMIDTAGTIVQGALALKEAGATEIIASCTHGVFSGPALERLENSPISEVIVLSTYEYKGKLTPKIKTISVAPLFAEAIERIYADLPLSKLYE